MTPNETVAVHMRNLRKKHGLLQAEVAELLGWTPGKVASAEAAGRPGGEPPRQFTVNDLVQLAGVFGVSPADLLAGVPREPRRSLVPGAAARRALFAGQYARNVAVEEIAAGLGITVQTARRYERDLKAGRKT